MLLTQRDVAIVSSKAEPLSEKHARTVKLELANIGYVLPSRLRARLAVASLDELAAFRTWALSTLVAHVGGDCHHELLFRRFPNDIPSNTRKPW